MRHCGKKNSSARPSKKGGKSERATERLNVQTKSKCSIFFFLSFFVVVRVSFAAADVDGTPPYVFYFFRCYCSFTDDEQTKKNTGYCSRLLLLAVQRRGDDDVYGTYGAECVVHIIIPLMLQFSRWVFLLLFRTKLLYSYVSDLLLFFFLSLFRFRCTCSPIHKMHQQKVAKTRFNQSLSVSCALSRIMRCRWPLPKG